MLLYQLNPNPSEQGVLMSKLLFSAALSVFCVNQGLAQPAIMGGATCFTNPGDIVTIWTLNEYVEELRVDTWDSDQVQMNWTHTDNSQGNLVEVVCGRDHIDLYIRGFGQSIVWINVPHGTEVQFGY